MNDGKFIEQKLPVSDSVRKRNPHLFDLGALETNRPKQAAQRPLDSDGAKRKGSAVGVVRISLTAYRHRLLDRDAVAFSMKPLTDIIAQTILGGTPGQHDDDPRLAWEWNQVETRGEEGVAVKIELTNQND